MVELRLVIKGCPMSDTIRYEHGRLPSYIPKRRKTGSPRFVRSVAFDEMMLRRIETEEAIARTEGRDWKFSDFSREAMRVALAKMQKDRQSGLAANDGHFTPEYRAAQRKRELERREEEAGKFAYERDEEAHDPRDS